MPDSVQSLQTMSPASEPSWEIVVFQVRTSLSKLHAPWSDLLGKRVEGRTFHAFRDTFARASEVFEGLFLLPQAEVAEGTSKDQPIVLQGCKKCDFAALMKVLHPSYVVTQVRFHDIESQFMCGIRRCDIVLSGNFNLSNEEWIGVLRLSTMWEMKKVCI